MAVEVGSIDFRAMGDEILANLPKALKKGAEFIRATTDPMVPRETGDLAGSGEVRMAGNDTAEIYYPGPYALYQHEGVYYRHGRVGAILTHTSGENFFLEKGVIKGKDGAIQIISDELLK